MTVAATVLSLVPTPAWAWCEAIYSDAQTDGSYVWYDVAVGFNGNAQGGECWVPIDLGATPYYQVALTLTGPNGAWPEPLMGGEWFAWAYTDVPVYEGGFGDYLGVSTVVENLCTAYFPPPSAGGSFTETNRDVRGAAVSIVRHSASGTTARCSSTISAAST